MSSCVCLVAQSCPLFAVPQTITGQVPVSTELPRQEHWSRLPFPPPGDLPNPRTDPKSPVSPALTGGFFTCSAVWEAHICLYFFRMIFLIYKEILFHDFFSMWFHGLITFKIKLVLKIGLKNVAGSQGCCDGKIFSLNFLTDFNRGPQPKTSEQ